MICSERKLLISLESSSGEDKLISCCCVSVDLLNAMSVMTFIETSINTLSVNSHRNW